MSRVALWQQIGLNAQYYSTTVRGEEPQEALTDSVVAECHSCHFQVVHVTAIVLSTRRVAFKDTIFSA